MTAPTSGRDPVEQLAEEFAERFRRGERPSLTEYTDRYPELAEEIRELFPALLEMEQLASVDGQGTGPHLPASPGGASAASTINHRANRYKITCPATSYATPAGVRLRRPPSRQ